MKMQDWRTGKEITKSHVRLVLSARLMSRGLEYMVHFQVAAYLTVSSVPSQLGMDVLTVPGVPPLLVAS